MLHLISILGASLTLLLSTDAVPARGLRGKRMLLTDLCSSGMQCSQYGGTCDDKGICVCKEGWTGDTCETRTIGRCGKATNNICNPSQGECDNDNEICICKDGWTGPNCVDDLNECSSLSGSPCSFPGGVCVDEHPELGKMYTCVCDESEGWVVGDSDLHGANNCFCGDSSLACGAITGLEGEGNGNEEDDHKDLDADQDGDGNNGVGNDEDDVTGLCVDDSGCPTWEDTQSSTCNTETGFCECGDGYFRTNEPFLFINMDGKPEWRQGSACQNENECHTGNNDCGSNSICQDLVPLAADMKKYACKCNEGFEPNGYKVDCVATPAPSNVASAVPSVSPSQHNTQAPQQPRSPTAPTYPPPPPPTPAPTPTPTSSPSVTPSPSTTYSPTASTSPTARPSQTPSAAWPSVTPSTSALPSTSSSPSITDITPSEVPSPEPSSTPSSAPTRKV